MDLYGNLFGKGQTYGGLLTEQDKEEARRKTMMAIATQLLQAGGPSRLPVSTGQAIGGALQAGGMAQDESYQGALQAALLRQKMQPQPKDRGKLVMVAGPDGKPVYKYEDDAAGQSPYLEPQGGTQQATDIQKWRAAQETGFKGTFEEWLDKDAARNRPPEKQRMPQWKLVPQPQPDGSVQNAWIDEGAGPGSPVIPFGAPKAATNEATEGERTSGNYYGRMTEAEKLLGTYQPTITDYIAAQNVMAGGPTRSIVANSALSPEGQKYYQAASDWVRAKLRKESGAVISPEEMAQEIKTYFPLPNDDKATIAQKAMARAQAMEGMKGMAGRSVTSGPSGAPKVGEVRKGYKYKGGDPASPSSWEKQ